MTAVPAYRKKAKDSFQVELDKEITRRRNRGLVTGFSDSDDELKKNENIVEDEVYSDDYEDDFQTESGSDNDLLQDYLKPLPTNTDQISSSKQTSSFKNEKLTSTMFITNNTSLLKSSLFPLNRQAAVDENNLEEDPLLAFLNKDKSKLDSVLKESDSVRSSISKQGSVKKKVTFQPQTSSLSPRHHESHSSISSQDMTNGNWNSVDKNKTSPRLHTSFSNKKKNFVSTDTMSDDILGDLKPLPSKHQNVCKEDKSLRPQPQARRRHDSNQSTISNESQTKSTIPSPDPHKVADTKMVEKENANTLFLNKENVSPVTRSTELDKQSFETDIITKMRGKDKKNISQGSPSLNLNETSKRNHQLDSDMSSSTEDLLAQLKAAPNVSQSKKAGFDISTAESVQAQPKNLSSSTPMSKEPPDADDNYVSARDAMVDNESINDASKLDLTYVVEKQSVDDSNMTIEPSKKTASARRRNDRKSPRTPPVNYKGLGSIEGLQQLRTLEKTDKLDLNSSKSVRSTVYMQWLADREEKLKARKKIERETLEQENEKRQKDLEEKVIEEKTARKAWMKKKQVVLKEQAQKKRIEEEKALQEKLKEKEDRRKSAQKADVVRQRALKEVKRRHQEELRRKKQEEKVLKEQEQEKKKKNEEELNKWMEHRAKQWEIDRKKEIREKKSKEKELKKQKEDKTKNAEDRYAEWKEKKEKQTRGKKKVSHHFEERPVWSPSNKVIPRAR